MIIEHFLCPKTNKKETNNLIISIKTLNFKVNYKQKDSMTTIQEYKEDIKTIEEFFRAKAVLTDSETIQSISAILYTGRSSLSYETQRQIHSQLFHSSFTILSTGNRIALRIAPVLTNQ